jgi:hypothetical protein
MRVRVTTNPTSVPAFMSENVIPIETGIETDVHMCIMQEFFILLTFFSGAQLTAE